MSDLLAAIQAEFDRLADPCVAESEQRFFKDQPIRNRGVRAPEIRRIARDVYARVKKLPVSSATASAIRRRSRSPQTRAASTSAASRTSSTAISP